MKIVSFTMVNNESEIIESFIRYNYNFVDHMIVIDNGCTDSTVEIVNRLREEGYKITVYDESLEAYNQFRLDNKYLRKTIDELQPDIILPLDADEFLTGDKNPRELLETLSLDKIYYIHWQWFVMTEKDDQSEIFIPYKMQYCFDEPAWNYSDGKPVTKTIIPAKYYDSLRLTLSMGHHSVFGNDKVEIVELDSLRLAHYRTISELQFVSKTSCYTMRDIATMENNFETAQRTNQMAMIECGENMWNTAVEASYGGYNGKIIHKPIDLSYCSSQSLKIKYAALAKENLAVRVMRTGQEMAVRAYNSERAKKEKAFIKPIVVWMDGVRGKECIFPNPSNKITILASIFNIRGYLTTSQEIKFLKANFRLIVTPDAVKFLPHQYIVIPDTVDFEDVKSELYTSGLAGENIVSLADYKKKLGVVKLLYCYIRFVPSMMGRIYAYLKRNGVKITIKKLKERIGK